MLVGSPGAAAGKSFEGYNAEQGVSQLVSWHSAAVPAVATVGLISALHPVLQQRLNETSGARTLQQVIG